MDAFSLDIAVNERFRKTLGDDAGRFEASEVERQREPLRALLVDVDPARDTTHFIAGSFDEEAARGKPGAHALPGVGDFFFVVLAQHIECPDDLGAARGGDFETSTREGDVEIGRESRLPATNRRELFARAGDPIRIDLESEDLRGGVMTAQTRREFDRGDSASPIAQVDDEGFGDGAQHGEPVDPSIDPSQTIRVGRPASDSALRAHRYILPPSGRDRVARSR